MGSVRINVDYLDLHGKGEASPTDELNPTDLATQAANALLRTLFSSDKAQAHLATWMDFHTYRNSAQPIDYPRGKQNEIFNWHTALRQEYSRLRRQENPDFNGFHTQVSERIVNADHQGMTFSDYPHINQGDSD